MSDYKLTYRIVESYPEERIYVVRFLSDFLTEEELKSSPHVADDGMPLRCRTDVSIEVPLTMENPTEDELEEFFWQFCPFPFFEKEWKRKQNLIKPLDIKVKTQPKQKLSPQELKEKFEQKREAHSEEARKKAMLENLQLTEEELEILKKI